jgi:hypothetical protein
LIKDNEEDVSKISKRMFQKLKTKIWIEDIKVNKVNEKVIHTSSHAEWIASVLHL